MFQFIDYYSLLSITPDSSSDEIESAFKSEAQSWHFGRYPEHNERAVMQYILDAKRVLLDPKLKVSYDKEYYRLRDSDRLTPLIKSELPAFDIDELWNELQISSKHNISKRSAFGIKSIPKPDLNLSDEQLWNVIQYAYSYDKSFVEFAREELLKRNHSQELIDNAIICKSSA